MSAFRPGPGPSIGIVALLALGVAGCGIGGGIEVPRTYGLYAVDDDKVGRLDGDPTFETATWEKRSQLSPDVEFLIVDRTLANNSPLLGDLIQLRHVARVRNAIGADGAVKTADREEWVVPDLPSYRVALDFEPVEDRDDTIRVTPRRPLEPGLYSLRLRGPGARINSRFGVRWQRVDQQKYAAVYCVDRYEGQPQGYKPCSEFNVAQGLELRDVTPIHGLVNGEPTLIVQGVVVNMSDRKRRVPDLEVSLSDDRGAEIKRWTLTAESPELLPGEWTGFRTETDWLPREQTNVTVSFVSRDDSG